MGRQQYLTRLALGRSAFEDNVDLPDDSPSDPAVRRTNSDPSETRHGRLYTPTWNAREWPQEYDAKGWPVNHRTQAFNAEMRTAQNDVYSLVGVVERKDLDHRQNQHRSRNERERRTALLNAEQEKGELLEYVFMPLSYLAYLWSDALISRIQIGFYDTNRSMADILQSELRRMVSGRPLDITAAVLPGLGEAIYSTLISLPLTVAVEQLTGRIQSYVHRRRFRRKTAKMLYFGISCFYEVAMLAIDVALLPMEFHARAQKMGLAPLRPFWPPVSSFLPWRSDSFHQFGWRSLFGVALLRAFTSPAALLLLRKVLQWDSDENQVFMCGVFTSYRYPSLDQYPDMTVAPSIATDAIGFILHKTWTIRARLMRWCGWDMYQIETQPSGALENNTRFSYDAQAGQRIDSLPRHRSTALAHLPAKRLAITFDAFFARLMTLPFEALLSRCLAQAFLLHSPSPKTSEAIEAASRLYGTHADGPFSRLIRFPSSSLAWTEAGTYVNRLGLALALRTSVDFCVFFAAYGTSRHIGRTYCEWRPRAPVDPNSERQHA